MTAHLSHTCIPTGPYRQVAAFLLHRMQGSTMGQAAVFDEIGTCAYCAASFVGLLADVVLQQYRLTSDDETTSRHLSDIALKIAALEATTL
jgi:hypothetical protein